MNIKKTISTLLTVSSLAVAFTGCQSESEATITTDAATTDTVLVLSYTSTGIYPTDELIAEEIIDSCSNGGTVTLIRLDGSPKIADTFLYEPIDIEKSESRQASDLQERMNEVTYSLNKCYAEAEGVDVLGGLQITSAVLESSDAEVKNLVFVNNGLSTRDPIDMTMLESSISDIDFTSFVSTLESNLEIPDLSTATSFKWYGLGQVDGTNQSKLSGKDNAVLHELWSAIIEAAGASAQFSSLTAASYTLEDLPAVPTVTVTDSSTAWAKKWELPPASTEFEDASPILKNEAAAIAALQEAANDLIADPSRRVYICGATATADTPEKCLNMSKQRADVIVKLMVERLGVNSSQLIPIGFGAGGPRHENDLNESGELIDDVAQRNRNVTIYAMDSEEGNRIAAHEWTMLT